ncbi:MAG: SPFH domain-containing protein [Clostridia bacterium]
MGFFKSQMWKVIEWSDNTQNTLVYKFPMNGQEIMSGSQLTVRESQVAIFVHLGKIADIFEAGKYKLTTKNLPVLSGIGSVFYQNESRFKSEVYFINTKQFVKQKWGTKNAITMRDNDFGMIRIKAFGCYGFKVNNAEVLLKELFGTNSAFTVEDIDEHLKTILISTMSDTIAESKVSALDMSANLSEFSGMCENNARIKFADLGLLCTNFTIENISFPEAVEKAIDERTNLGILGDKMGTYTQKKAADALGDAAKNSGTAGAFIGMGLGSQAGSALGGVFSNVSNAQDTSVVKEKVDAGRFCSECGAKMTTKAKFCPECGAKQATVKVCAKCGAVLKDTAKFCPECGEKV